MIIRLRGLRAAFFWRQNSYNILVGMQRKSAGSIVIAIALQGALPLNTCEVKFCLAVCTIN
ncbi:hypothetical protein BFG58_01445 [Enterobacter sp. ku-bf2]|nr:hypothetical protein BFG58_01445 [Enterobacter sp. ku-bf2]